VGRRNTMFLSFKNKEEEEEEDIENVPISNAHNISSRRLRWNVVQFFNNCIHMGPILDIFYYKREEGGKKNKKQN
jgi:hypothetical protein